MAVLVQQENRLLRDKKMQQILKEAADKALESSNHLDSLEKWKHYSKLYEIKRNGGKNAVGDFGENILNLYYLSKGIPSKIIKNGHDVFVQHEIPGKRKKEVKTAFWTGSNYWFNQIYYKDKNTGINKDWQQIVFVFVKPGCIEIWECDRPENPEVHFKWNNGWSWQKAGPHKLDASVWKLVEKFDFKE